MQEKSQPKKSSSNDLKTKITKRWNILSRHQTWNPFPQGGESTAFAQLEYILIEAGLLAERRERPAERAMRLAAAEPEFQREDSDVG